MRCRFCKKEVPHKCAEASRAMDKLRERRNPENVKAQLAAARKAKAGIPARVKSANFSMGNSVDVYLTDATPAIKKLAEEIAKPFQYGHFDGMQDLYEYSNRRTDLPAQAKYVSVTNDISDETAQKVWDFMRSYLDGAQDAPESYREAMNIIRINGEYVAQLVWRQFSQADSAYWNHAKAA